ncbi:MAG: hypothetical protein AAF205_08335 [Pseudomonadota bacterium]
MGFDQDRWNSGAGNFTGENPREGMIGDVRDVVSYGMLRTDVHAVLGPPDSSGRDVDGYALGRSAVGVDFETLEIGYADGRVVRVDVTTT